MSMIHNAMNASDNAYATGKIAADINDVLTKLEANINHRLDVITSQLAKLQNTENTEDDSLYTKIDVNIKSVWTDRKRKHSIEENWTAHNVDELISSLKEALDVPDPDVFSDGPEKHAETLRRYGADEEFIKSEWNRIKDAMKHYDEARITIFRRIVTQDLTSYVIDVDPDTKVYVSVM